jgi:hypothetical protein
LVASAVGTYTRAAVVSTKTATRKFDRTPDAIVGTVAAVVLKGSMTATYELS